MEHHSTSNAQVANKGAQQAALQEQLRAGADQINNLREQMHGATREQLESIIGQIRAAAVQHAIINERIASLAQPAIDSQDALDAQRSAALRRSEAAPHRRNANPGATPLVNNGAPPVHPYQEHQSAAGAPPIHHNQEEQPPAGVPPIHPNQEEQPPAGVPPIHPNQEEQPPAGAPPVHPNQEEQPPANASPTEPNQEQPDFAANPNVDALPNDQANVPEYEFVPDNSGGRHTGQRVDEGAFFQHKQYLQSVRVKPVLEKARINDALTSDMVDLSDAAVQNGQRWLSPVIEESLTQYGITDLWRPQLKLLRLMNGSTKATHTAITGPIGMGKSMAVMLYTINRVETLIQAREAEESDGTTTIENGPVSPQFIILQPSHQIATEMFGIMRCLTEGTRVKVKLATGKTNLVEQTNRMMSGADIVVGTCGRVVHMAKDGTFGLSQIDRIFVDEMDRFLDEGKFRDALQYFSSNLSDNRDFKFFFLGASLTLITKAHINALIGDDDLVIRQIGRHARHTIKVNEYWWDAPADLNARMQFLIDYLNDPGRRLEGDVDGVPGHVDPDKTIIIFVDKKETTFKIRDMLVEVGEMETENVAIISSMNTHQEREHTTNSAKEEKVAIVIATRGTFGRGLNIKSVGTIIHFDLFASLLEYNHTCGRAGREGELANVVNLMSQERDRNLLEEYVAVFARADDTTLYVNGEVNDKQGPGIMVDVERPPNEQQ